MATPMSTITTTVFNLYLAIVCAFSLLATVIIAGSGISTAIDFAYPAPIEVNRMVFDNDLKRDVERSPEAIAEEERQQLARQSYYRVRDMLHSFAYFFLASMVFAIHWRLFRKRVVLSEKK